MTLSNKYSLLLNDFSKAFDQVDHRVLLRKLCPYGIRGVAHKWLETYLSNRDQFVSVGGAEDEVRSPQGSILGPLQTLHVGG